MAAMVLAMPLPKNTIKIMGFKVKVLNTKIIKKLESMGIFIQDRKTDSYVKDQNFYNHVSTGLGYGFSNMLKEYDLNMVYDVDKFIRDFEREPASDNFIDTTIRKELEKVLDTCRKKDWKILIYFENPIYGIHSILVNFDMPGIDYDIVFQSTMSMEKAAKGIEPMMLGDKMNKHYLFFV